MAGSAPTFGSRRPLWIALLILASLALGLGFACAVPLAAFAAIGALTLSRRDAFALVGAIWFANQIAGFAIHHYPIELSTFGWGFALGAVTLASTLAAHSIKDLFRQNSGAVAAAAFVAAFAVYEGSLFAISLFLGSGVSNFAPSIVRRILAINVTAFAALFSIHRLGAFADLPFQGGVSSRGAPRASRLQVEWLEGGQDALDSKM